VTIVIILFLGAQVRSSPNEWCNPVRGHDSHVNLLYE
jgi:hypothetical protein